MEQKIDGVYPKKPSQFNSQASFAIFFFVKEMIVCDIKMHVTDLIHLSRLVTE